MSVDNQQRSPARRDTAPSSLQSFDARHHFKKAEFTNNQTSPNLSSHSPLNKASIELGTAFSVVAEAVVEVVVLVVVVVMANSQCLPSNPAEH